MSHDTPAQARPSIGGFPLLAWFLATLAFAHTGAMVSDLWAGGGGPLAAGVDGAAAIAVVVGLVLGWGRTNHRAFQLTAVGLITVAALASGVRAAGAGQPWFGADIVLVLLATVALVSRRDAALALICSLAAWSSALVVGTVAQPVAARPSGGSWVSLGLLLASCTVVAAGLRLGLAAMRAAHDSAARLAEAHAVSDPLTGAGNRRGLELLATPMIEHARRQGEAVNCLFIDLDDFRKVNEQLGRDHGDHVLKQVSEAVLASVRVTDVVTRWAGDQFVVVGPGTGTSPLEMERRVRTKLAAEPAAPTEVWAGQVSIGSATLVPWDEGNLDSLLGRAEEDMQLRRSLRRQSRERGRSTATQAPGGSPVAERRAKPPGSSATKPPGIPPGPPPSVQNDL